MPLSGELTRVRRTRGLTVAGIFLAVLVVLGGLLAARWPFTKSRIIKSIRDSWPGMVNADRVRSTYFPHPGCVIENFVLSLPSDHSQDPVLVTIARAQIQASYADLFVRPRFLTRLAMEGLRIELPVYGLSSGQQNSTSASRPFKTDFGEVDAQNAVLVVKRSRGAAPLIFNIHRAVLYTIKPNAPMSYDGLVSNPVPPGEVHVHGQFGPWTSKQLKDIPLSGSYTFENADLTNIRGIAGVLSSTGKFGGPLGQIAIRGSIDIPAFQVTRSPNQVPIKARFDAIVNATNGDVTLKTVDASFLHTEVHAGGTIASEQHGKAASLNLNVERGQIQDVLELFVRSKVPPMDGITDFRTHVIIPPGQEPFLKKIVMEGTFAIRDAVLTNQRRQNDINQLSKRASGEKNQKVTERVSAHLDGKVLLRNGNAMFSPVSFEIPGASILMTGRFNVLNEHLDFHGDAWTRAELSDDTTGLKSVLLKPFDIFFKKKHAGAKIPVEMTGTYEKPHWGIDLSMKK